MIYLALDQALKTTGFAVFNDNELVKWGTFTTNSTLPIEQRLGTFWTQLNKLSEKCIIDEIFLEDIQQQKGNVETYKKLCYVQAAIYLWCYFNSIPCSTLGPSHWRKIIKDKYKISFGKVRAEQNKAAIQFSINTCKQNTEFAHTHCNKIHYCA